jgi:protein O-mannosyl-transferase
MKELELQSFLYHFCTNKRQNKKYCFILGAGASKQSGIPTGAELVKEWLTQLNERDGKEKTDQWMKDENISPDDPAKDYSKIYKNRFYIDPLEGFAFLEKIMDNVEPSCGYSVLAHILETQPHNIVITTNFDSLTEDALFIYTRKKPLVVGHEALADFVDLFVTRPVIVKVHRDLLFAPKSNPEDTSALSTTFSKKLANIFKYYTPLVIGYGGNDGSLMDYLNSLDTIEGGIFWFYRKDGGLNDHIKSLIEKFDGYAIPITGFDEMMIQLGNKLGYSRMDKIITETAEQRAQKYREQFEKASQSEKTDNITQEAFSEIVERGEKDWLYYEVMARNEKDTNKRDKIYNDAILALPASYQLLGNYAVFLKNTLKDDDKAEKYYIKALERNPDYDMALGNYANFLRYRRKDDDKAEEYYIRAIKANPKNANSLGNYASFLYYIRKDYDKAEEYFTKAIEADSKRANNLGNYATFLYDIRKNYDKAEELYKKVIEINPKYAKALGNYATFLSDIRKDYDKAEEYHTKAIEADSKYAINLGRYALFLSNIRKDYDKAEECHTKAIEADPKDANILGNYAIFLYDIRKDYDKAEEYYTKAVEADPKNADILGNYAYFLYDNRKDYDKAEEYYVKAIEADSKNVNVLGSYAYFLYDNRKNYNKAEEYYTKAIEADSKNANNLGNYAKLLITTTKEKEAKDYIEKAFEANKDKQKDALELELWFYCYAIFWNEYPQAKEKIQELLNNGIKSPGWNLKEIVRIAKEKNHLEPELVEKFAKEISGIE